MINEALMHCSGIGPVRLKQLKAAGLHAWTDIISAPDAVPKTLRKSLVAECQACVAALEQDDIPFFVNRLHAKDKWRILSEYRDRTSYFDIETVGLDYDARISVIVVWHRGELHEFVEHENLDDFLDLLDDVELLASFNGSSFDVPRVVDAFHIPGLPCPHLDLRWLCYHHGFQGGLKEISSRLGIRRPADLNDVDGELAIRLWQRWEHFQDDSARSLLLRYCCADVLLLAILAEQLGEARPDLDDETDRADDAKQVSTSGGARQSGSQPEPHPLWKHLPPMAGPMPSETPTQQDGSQPVEGDFGPAAPSKLRGRRSRFAS